MNKKYLNLSSETQYYFESAITDGKLSEREIDFIKKKAAEYGDDPDEVQMVLDAVLLDLEKGNIKNEDNESIEITPKYGLIDSYLKALRKYSKINERASRSEFWNFIVFNFIIYFTLFTIIGIQVVNYDTDENILIVGLFGSLYPLFIITPFISLCIRRLHDLNLSGWFALMPLYNLYLFSKKGYVGSNKYGEDPYKIVIKKIAKSKDSIIESLSVSKIETIGVTMFGIGATLHEAIDFKFITYNQLDQINKWLWIIGGLLMIIPRSIRFLLRKT